jgi:hypothetical protein
VRHSSLRFFGVLALACFAVHAAVLLQRSEAPHVLWACHVATLIIGAGLLSKSPTPIAVGVCWLAVGTPAWLVDLWRGAEQIPTSALTHVVGLTLGLIGVCILGWPRGAWWKAFVALVGLALFCRFATPPSENVNMAFRVWERWGNRMPGFAATAALALSVHLFVFHWMERRFRRDQEEPA